MENPPIKVSSLREGCKLIILRELGNNQRVRNAYGEFIARYPWEWFVTLTFIERIHPESARKSLNKWLDILNSSLYTRKWRKKLPTACTGCFRMNTKNAVFSISISSCQE